MSVFSQKPHPARTDIASFSQISELSFPREFTLNTNPEFLFTKSPQASMWLYPWVTTYCQYTAFCAFSTTKEAGKCKDFSISTLDTVNFLNTVLFPSKWNQNFPTFLTVPKSNNEQISSSSFPKYKYFKEERKNRQIQRNVAVLMQATLLGFLAV